MMFNSLTLSSSIIENISDKMIDCYLNQLEVGTLRDLF